MSDLVTLLHGDCLEVMPTLESESVDAVVTDPPYGLGFMGKHWDHGVPAVEFWQQMIRVTKPGGYLLAFGGTRTVHRIATNIEDAGWSIRDMLMWIYASGFPKGKANLKPAHEPIVLARKPGPLRPLAIDECRIGTDGGHEGAGPGPSQGILGDGLNGSRAEPVAGLGRWPSNVLLSDPELFDQPNPYVVGSGATAGDKGGGFYVQPPGQKSYEGPAYVGASKGQHINAAGREPFHYGDSGGYSRFFKVPSRGNDDSQTLVGGEQRVELPDVPEVALGDSQDAQGLSPEPELNYPNTFIIPKTGRAERERGLGDRPKFASGLHDDDNYRQPGERKANHTAPMPRANVHPTVKPIDLMRHLVRLVTPPGGVVLDPFLGSGTTALAASEEGFRCIGIEREAEYLDIARGRLIATPMGMGL